MVRAAGGALGAALGAALFLAAPGWASDAHSESVRRLVGAAASVADDARKGGGKLTIANGPKMSQRACRDFFQDLVSLNKLEVLPTADPDAVLLRWRGRQEVRVVARGDGVHTVLARGSTSWPLCSARRAEPEEPVNDTRMPDSAAAVFPLDLRNAPSAVPLEGSYDQAANPRRNQ